MAAALNLSALPQDCLALILARTTPAEAVRLSSVCQAFAGAAMSETMWDNLLPSNHAEVYGNALRCNKNGNDGACVVSKKDMVEWLAKGVYLGNGLQRYLLLWQSGSVCRMLSIADMDVAWRHDLRTWDWEESRCSHFGKVAHLLAVNWLEIRGKWSCSLPPGIFSLAWRLKVANPRGGRPHFLSWKEPLCFSASTCDGQVLYRELDLSLAPKKGYGEWFEFEVGQFRVTGPRLQVKQVNLELFIKEIHCAFWKGGLFLDCVTMRPSVCKDQIYKSDADLFVSTLRGRPGVF